MKSFTVGKLFLLPNVLLNKSVLPHVSNAHQYELLYTILPAPVHINATVLTSILPVSQHLPRLHTWPVLERLPPRRLPDTALLERDVFLPAARQTKSARSFHASLRSRQQIVFCTREQAVQRTLMEASSLIDNQKNWNVT